MKTSPIILLLFLFSLSISSIESQELSGDDLEVRLFLIGQGDPLYSSWGHTGLAIRNNLYNSDVFFDFGNFYFEDNDFFKNFAVGRLLYMAWAAETAPYLEQVKRDDRSIIEYVLNLPSEKKMEMYVALINKTRPENRTYLYHNYFDNCSTRIRDYIDHAVDGQLKNSSQAMEGTTYRKSFLRFTDRNRPSGFALSLLQGPPIDKRINLWQEMYLPEVMGEVLADFVYTDDDGNTRTLVSEINKLYISPNRKEIPREHDDSIPLIILLSAFLSGIISYSRLRAERDQRTLLSVVSIISGLIFGLLGCLLLFLAGFTDHTYAHGNLNLFMINPLALFAIPAAILYWFKGEAWKRKLDLIWTIQLTFTCLMIVIKALTPISQENLPQIILFLPILAALSPLPIRLLKKKLLR